MGILAILRCCVMHKGRQGSADMLELELMAGQFSVALDARHGEFFHVMSHALGAKRVDRDPGNP